MTDGQWLDNIGDSGTEYYQVSDPGKGTLHLAATIRPTGLGTADSLEVKVTVTSADGTECGSARESGVGAFSGSNPVTATFSLLADDKEDCGKGPYTLALESPVTSEQPLAVWVYSEPGVKSVDGLPPATTDADWAPEEATPFAADPQPVEGATSHTDAPTLEPGTYTDTLLAGELLFYRVDVDWGQSLVCEAKVAAKPEVSSRASEFLRAQTYGFNGGEILNTGAKKEADLWVGDEGAQVIATTKPVRYLNRESSLDSDRSSMVAGGYYCAFRVGTRALNAVEMGDLELTINVSTPGNAGEGKPDYLAKPTSAKKADKAAATGDDESGSNVGVLGGIGVGLLALLAAAFWYFRRMRRA